MSVRGAALPLAALVPCGELIRNYLSVHGRGVSEIVRPVGANARNDDIIAKFSGRTKCAKCAKSSAHAAVSALATSRYSHDHESAPRSRSPTRECKVGHVMRSQMKGKSVSYMRCELPATSRQARTWPCGLAVRAHARRARAAVHGAAKDESGDAGGGAKDEERDHEGRSRGATASKPPWRG